ncbi:MAG: IS630 family transposase [Alphaproteobacteria bacterium]|nr:IS630 family transposase [Alphaproteobacteria bacterium]
MNKEITPEKINEQIGHDDQARRPRLWLRLSIMALCQHNIERAQIARFLGCHIQTVRIWEKRFCNNDSIYDKIRPGAKPKFLEDTGQRVIAFFCQFETLPGYARWTLSAACQYFENNPELLGEDVVISRASIHRLLDAHALKPHRFRYFLHLSDSDFFTKMDHIIEVYASVSKNLFCFDECTGIQALEYIAPPTPAGPDCPKYLEVEYIRHGSISVFSVLEVSTGQVFTEVIEDHTSATIIEVLRRHINTVSPTEMLHYICDNYGSHSTTDVCKAVGELCGVDVPKLMSVAERREWLSSTDKRVVFHFLPFHGSWLNLIENWFGIMKKNCLDRCSVCSKEELSQNIMNFNNTWNQEYAHPFKWAYNGEDLRGKTVRKFTYWLQEESSLMSGKFLKKQLKLMTNLINDDWAKVPMHDWSRLGAIIEDKQEYLNSVVTTIDSNTFKNIKAKSEEERKTKIVSKIEKAKQVLQERICDFRKVINTALTNMLNCEKEVLIQ